MLEWTYNATLAFLNITTKSILLTAPGYCKSSNDNNQQPTFLNIITNLSLMAPEGKCNLSNGC